MTYELAKQLKDAGFPIPAHTDCDRESGGCCRCGDDDQDICIPTLSELIEACGDGFHDLCRHPDEFYKKGSGMWNTNRDDLWDCELPNSNTPEEAVAKLWLSL